MLARRFFRPQSRLFEPFRKNGSLGAGTSAWKSFACVVSSSAIGAPFLVACGSGSVEVHRGVLAQLVEAVAGVDQSHRPRLRPHDERLGGGPVVVVVDALQQLTVGDAGGREEAVVAGDEVVLGEDLLEVVALFQGGVALLVVAGV